VLIRKLLIFNVSTKKLSRTRLGISKKWEFTFRKWPFLWWA